MLGDYGIRRALSERDRVARYREHAAYFTELAGTEAVEKIRDQWEHLARDYAYLAARLESD